jgi:threonine/homoserine/homoserine lactone efflux protein
MAGQALSHPQLWQQLLALVLASAVVMGSPGPATISVAAVGAAFGLRDSLRYAWGIVLGTIAVLLVVATGIMVVVASLPKLAPLLAARAGGAAPPTFLGGFLLAVVNPKAYVAIAAMFAGAASRASAGDLGISAKLVVLALMIIAIHVLWLLAGAAFARLLRKPLTSRIINLTFAATLVLTTALAALS